MTNRKYTSKTEEIQTNTKKSMQNIIDTHKTENIHMKQESRHEKSSKPSADTFLWNSIFLPIESLNFRNMSGFSLKIPFKGFKCASE